MGTMTAERSMGQSVLLFARDLVLIVLAALVVSFLIKTFLIRSFFIPTDSMEPTLVRDDRIIVSQLTPDVINVQRGDVVVFDRITTDGEIVRHDDLIKRVIGLPGEEVEIRDCVVIIDGVPLTEPWLTPDMRTNCGVEEMDPVLVGSREIFVVGDHRDQSYDSRMFGTVSQSLIRGQAVVVIWPPRSVTLL